MSRSAGEVKMSKEAFDEIYPKIMEALFEKKVDIEQLDHTGATTMFAFDIDEDADTFPILSPVFDLLASKKTEDSIDETIVLGRERQNVFVRQGWWVKLSKDETLERALMIKGRIFNKFIEQCEKDKTSPAEVLSNMMLMTIFTGTLNVEKFDESELDALEAEEKAVAAPKKKKASKKK